MLDRLHSSNRRDLEAVMPDASGIPKCEECGRSIFSLKSLMRPDRDWWKAFIPDSAMDTARGRLGGTGGSFKLRQEKGPGESWVFIILAWGDA
jgi:hypothetical protein